MSRLTVSAQTLAGDVAAKSGHGIPVGWIGFGAVMIVLLVIGVRWARGRNNKG
ncbi:MAG TPA: hypothetical protein VJ843_03605 [Candidatus Saccharimonadales bacterium]|nr:hypothetical protein [Candidatus Saccharimonadales bacterium]